MSIQTCPICSVLIDSEDMLDHKEWHEWLESMLERTDRSPAPIAEDAVSRPVTSTHTEASDEVLSRGRDRILAAARRDPDQCGGEHDWPPEITPYSQCSWCGLNYKDWREEEHKDPKTCQHKWPDIELTSYVKCERCGTPYGQWSLP